MGKKSETVWQELPDWVGLVPKLQLLWGIDDLKGSKSGKMTKVGNGGEAATGSQVRRFKLWAKACASAAQIAKWDHAALQLIAHEAVLVHRTGPLSNRRRWPGWMNCIFFEITWMAKCMCMAYLGLWEEAEAVWWFGDNNTFEVFIWPSMLSKLQICVLDTHFRSVDGTWRIWRWTHLSMGLGCCGSQNWTSTVFNRGR